MHNLRYRMPEPLCIILFTRRIRPIRRFSNSCNYCNGYIFSCEKEKPYQKNNLLKFDYIKFNSYKIRLSFESYGTFLILIFTFEIMIDFFRYLVNKRFGVIYIRFGHILSLFWNCIIQCFCYNENANWIFISIKFQKFSDTASSFT